MTDNKNDKLKSLFQDIKIGKPSIDFENRLMQRIYTLENRRNKKKIHANKLKTSLAIGGGICAIVGIPMLLFFLLGWTFIDYNQLTNINISLPNVGKGSPILPTACIFSLLLIGDILIRRKIKEKKK